MKRKKKKKKKADDGPPPPSMDPRLPENWAAATGWGDVAHLVRRAEKRVGSEATDAVAIAVAALDRHEPPTHVGGAQGWVWTAVRTACTDLWRGKKRTLPAISLGEMDPESLQQPEDPTTVIQLPRGTWVPYWSASMWRSVRGPVAKLPRLLRMPQVAYLLARSLSWRDDRPAPNLVARRLLKDAEAVATAKAQMALQETEIARIKQELTEAKRRGAEDVQPGGEKPRRRKHGRNPRLEHELAEAKSRLAVWKVRLAECTASSLLDQIHFERQNSQAKKTVDQAGMDHTHGQDQESDVSATAKTKRLVLDALHWVAHVDASDRPRSAETQELWHHAVLFAGLTALQIGQVGPEDKEIPGKVLALVMDRLLRYLDGMHHRPSDPDRDPEARSLCVALYRITKRFSSDPKPPFGGEREALLDALKSAIVPCVPKGRATRVEGPAESWGEALLDMCQDWALLRGARVTLPMTHVGILANPFASARPWRVGDSQ